MMTSQGKSILLRILGLNGALGLVPRLSIGVSAVLLFVITWIVVAEIIARQGFSFSLHWAVEYTEYFVPILALWGAAYTLRKDGHVNADVVLHLFGNKTRQWLLLIGYILGLVFSIILCIQLFNLSLSNIELGLLSLYPSESPYGYVQLFLSIGLALFCLQLIVEICRKIRRLVLTHRGEVIIEVPESKVIETDIE